MLFINVVAAVADRIDESGGSVALGEMSISPVACARGWLCENTLNNSINGANAPETDNARPELTHILWGVAKVRFLKPRKITANIFAHEREVGGVKRAN